MSRDLLLAKNAQGAERYPEGDPLYASPYAFTLSVSDSTQLFQHDNRKETWIM